MSEQEVKSKGTLMAAMAAGWQQLNEVLDQLDERQMTTLHDAQGWTVKDHLVHLAAWERSVVSLLQGHTRAEGLGVSNELFLEEGYDEINRVVYEQTQDITLSEARSKLRDVHVQLAALLQPMSDEDLLRPYSELLPEELRSGETRRLIDVVHANSGQHFDEHRIWIKRIVTSPGNA